MNDGPRESRRSRPRCGMLLLFAAMGSNAPRVARATAAPSKPLGELSLAELGDVDVTSVSKKEEKLSDAAAAIYVITAEDIRRSGAMSLPEILRLAPNLEVARIDSNQYAISARGFDSTTANKLLVLIDGRSVYTPLYSGVFWDAQDVLLEDIERIEVISGPGGTLWGSNAVNGVINIITRRAADTHGTLIKTAVGTEDRGVAAIRYGNRLAKDGSYRVYAKYFDRDETVLGNGTPAGDAWHSGQLGFRLDWGKAANAWSVHGDAYEGAIDQPGAADKTREGANLFGRWQRDLGKDSDVQVTLYLDRTRRDLPGVFNETRNTIDLDVVHRLRRHGRHDVLWGGGYRDSSDDVGNSAALAFLPAKKDLRLGNLFLQDTIAFNEGRTDVTLGAKLEHNDYTGLEVQPSVRVGWKVRRHQLLWTAISRAVRTPSRIDREFFFSAPLLQLAGGPAFRSETLLAYEVGWRVQAARATVSVSGFYNVYDHLRTVEPTPVPEVFVIANQMKGETYGVEAWADIRVTKAWRLEPGYAYLEQDLRLRPGSFNFGGTTSEGNDPRHRISLGSFLDLGHHVELDGTARYVSALPSPAVPGYTTLDARLSWKPGSKFELSLIGLNLLDKQHPEFGDVATRSEIERAGVLRATWTF